MEPETTQKEEAIEEVMDKIRQLAVQRDKARARAKELEEELVLIHEARSEHRKEEAVLTNERDAARVQLVSIQDRWRHEQKQVFRRVYPTRTMPRFLPTVDEMLDDFEVLLRAEDRTPELQQELEEVKARAKELEDKNVDLEEENAALVTTVGELKEKCARPPYGQLHDALEERDALELEVHRLKGYAKAVEEEATGALDRLTEEWRKDREARLGELDEVKVRATEAELACDEYLARQQSSDSALEFTKSQCTELHHRAVKADLRVAGLEKELAVERECVERLKTTNADLLFSVGELKGVVCDLRKDHREDRVMKLEQEVAKWQTEGRTANMALERARDELAEARRRLLKHLDGPICASSWNPKPLPDLIDDHIPPLVVYKRRWHCACRGASVSTANTKYPMPE